MKTKDQWPQGSRIRASALLQLGAFGTLFYAAACGCSSTEDHSQFTGTGGSEATGGNTLIEKTGGQTSGGHENGTGGSDSWGSGGTGVPTGGVDAVGTGGNSAVTPADCEASVSETNRTLVATAIDELFIDQDLTAIDRYWSEPYLQHNPIAASGLSTFRSVMSSFVTSPSFQFTRLRTFADCDLVVVQGRYSGTGVIFDMFRVTDGKIMEHWDSDANQASATDGPTALADLEKTANNRASFDIFFDALLVQDTAAIEASLATSFVTHRLSGETGPNAWLSYINTESLVYSELHHQIVDGNFVFTLSEGTRNGTPYGFYDLFRLDDGMIVEHWDSKRVVPNSTASGLDIF